MKCKVCGKPVTKKAIYLYDTDKGPVYVCGKRCFRRYEGG